MLRSLIPKNDEKNTLELSYINREDKPIITYLTSDHTFIIFPVSIHETWGSCTDSILNS